MECHLPAPPSHSPKASAWEAQNLPSLETPPGYKSGVSSQGPVHVQRPGYPATSSPFVPIALSLTKPFSVEKGLDT